MRIPLGLVLSLAVSVQFTQIAVGLASPPPLTTEKRPPDWPSPVCSPVFCGWAFGWFPGCLLLGIKPRGASLVLCGCAFLFPG